MRERRALPEGLRIEVFGDAEATLDWCDRELANLLVVAAAAERRIGDKWSTLIVLRLGQRTHRFNELHREIDGISQRMLTLTLRALVRDGLVSGTVYPTVPPRVDYELTELGRTLLTPITALHEWAVAHRDDIRHARAQHDHATDV